MSSEKVMKNIRALNSYHGDEAKIFVCFTFSETFKDVSRNHQNFTLLGQGRHEIPMWVSDPGTKILGIQRVNT